MESWVKFTPWPLYSGEKKRRWQENTRLLEPQSPSADSEKQNNFLPLPEFEPRIILSVP